MVCIFNEVLQKSGVIELGKFDIFSVGIYMINHLRITGLILALMYRIFYLVRQEANVTHADYSYTLNDNDVLFSTGCILLYNAYNVVQLCTHFM